MDVNIRVNYPIKTALVEFENNSVFDMENETDKFFVSRVSCQVASYGLQVCIRSWNSHPIPSKLAIMKSYFFLKLIFQYLVFNSTDST